MQHHHAAPVVAIWISMFASMVAVAVSVLAGAWNARRPERRAFDFAASARRIRAMPIRSRDELEGS